MTPVGDPAWATANTGAVHAALTGFAAAVETYLARVAAGDRFEAAEALGDADRAISDACWAAGVRDPHGPAWPQR